MIKLKRNKQMIALITAVILILNGLIPAEVLAASLHDARVFGRSIDIEEEADGESKDSGIDVEEDIEEETDIAEEEESKEDEEEPVEENDAGDNLEEELEEEQAEELLEEELIPFSSYSDFHDDYWTIYDKLIATGDDLLEAIEDIYNQNSYRRTDYALRISEDIVMKEQIVFDENIDLIFVGTDSEGNFGTKRNITLVNEKGGQPAYGMVIVEAYLVFENVSLSNGGILIEDESFAYLTDIELYGVEKTSAIKVANSSGFNMEGGRIHNNGTESNPNAYPVISITGESTADMWYCEFTDNHTMTDGGAFYLSNSGISGFNLKISGNTAKRGAAIYLTNDAESDIMGGFDGITEISFNKSSGEGGAVYAENSHMFFEGYTEPDVLISNNISGGSGGGIYALSTEMEVEGLTLTGNKAELNGGGIYIENKTHYLGWIHFYDNEAALNGGGIYIKNLGRYTNLFGHLYQGNRAGENGGGVMVDEANRAVVLNLGGFDFIDNHAEKYGGGLYSRKYVRVSGGGYVEVSEGNSAGIDGGAIYLELDGMEEAEISYMNLADNSAGRNGGAIYLSGPDVVELSRLELTDNLAEEKGGSIYVEDINELSISGIEVNGGNAYEGAGIYIHSVDEIDIYDISVNGGKSENRGGGIYFSDISNIEARYLEANYNEAYESAAIYFDSVGRFSSDVLHLLGNKAETQAGGLMLDTPIDFDVEYFYLEDNSAGEKGGGIVIKDLDSFDTEAMELIGNSAENGGALYISNVDYVQITDIAAEENHAVNGAAVYMENVGVFENEHIMLYENTVENIGGVFLDNVDEINIESIESEGNIGLKGAVIAVINSGSLRSDTIWAVENTGNAVLLSDIEEVHIEIIDAFENSGYEGTAAIFENIKSLEIDDIMAEFNTAEHNGGVIVIENVESFNALSIYCYENHAGNFGGGLMAVNVGEMNVESMELDGNSAKDGGALYLDNIENFYVDTLNFFENKAKNNGGGMLVLNSGDFYIEELNALENRAKDGGAVYIAGVNKFNSSMTSMEENIVSGSGGAIFITETALSQGNINFGQANFESNRAGNYVNVINNEDYELYSKLFDTSEGWFIVDDIKMYYMGAEGLIDIYEEMEQSYWPANNYDIGYNGMTYKVEYVLYDGTIEGENTYYDSNHYSAGIISEYETDEVMRPIALLDASLIELEDKEFIGWVQTNGGALIEADQYGYALIDISRIEGNYVRIHAQYSEDMLEVIFDANGGKFDLAAETDGAGILNENGQLIVSVVYGGDVDEPSGYLNHRTDFFAGWYFDKEGGEVASLTEITEEEMVAYAHWVKFDPSRQFQIIYHIELDTAGTEIYYSNVYEGTVGSKDNIGPGYTDPTMPGYYFMGWYEIDGNGDYVPEHFDFTRTIENGSVVHLYAKWRPSRIVVENDEKSETDIFVLHNGEQVGGSVAAGELSEIIEVDEDSVIAITRPVGARLATYAYEALSENENVNAQYVPAQDGNGYIIYEIESDIKVIVETEIRRYDISFYNDSGYGSRLDSFTVKYEHNLSDILMEENRVLPEPVKEGYTFLGWTSGAEKDFVTEEKILNNPVYDNMNYYASWSEINTENPDTAKPDAENHDKEDRSTTVSQSGANVSYEGIYPQLEKRRIPYIVGFPDGTVGADLNMTRAEISMALFKLVIEEDKNYAVDSVFADVEEGQWYAQAVNYLAGYGILSGYPDGTFKPEENITRAEFTAVISRFGGMEEGIAGFSDVSENHWALSYIGNAYVKGLVSGYPDGSFRPDASITRAEAITIINKMLGRAPESNEFNPEEIPYIDLTAAHWAWADILEATIGGVIREE